MFVFVSCITPHFVTYLFCVFCQLQVINGDVFLFSLSLLYQWSARMLYSKYRLNFLSWFENYRTFTHTWLSAFAATKKEKKKKKIIFIRLVHSIYYNIVSNYLDVQQNFFFQFFSIHNVLDDDGRKKRVESFIFCFNKFYFFEENAFTR